MKNNIEGGKPEKKLSPEEKEIARSLENFPFLLKKDKVFLVLVWRGLKTASSVSILSDAPASAVDDLRKIAEKAGLFFKFDREIMEDSRGLTKGKVCFVANNQKDLDLISKLWFGDHDNDPAVYKEIGRMSGFSQTAIDVYEKISEAGILKLPKKEKYKALQKYVLSYGEKKNYLLCTNEVEVIPFSVLFYMPREHYAKEMGVPRKWAKEVKSVVPRLYEQFTGPFVRSVVASGELK
ncbi:MAG: hypothetical protein AAB933_01035 [Patescibacteria group bacterium]